MVLADGNVLIYAFREDAPDHNEYRDWLNGQITSHEAFGLSDVVLSGVIRVLTHPRVFRTPTPPDLATAYADALRAQPNAVLLQPGVRHWLIFADLVRSARAKGNLVADAFLAALAIEHGCEWITTDRDFARFPGLRWRHPIA